MDFGVVDWVIVVLAVGFAVNGFRQGLVTSLLSMIGFVGGAVGGIQLASPIATHVASGNTQTVVAVIVVVVAALAGQVLAVYIGHWLRDRLTWRPARAVDSVLGGVVSLATVLLVAWMVATPLASSPYPNLSAAVRQSQIVRGVNEVVPAPVRNVYTSLRDTVNHGDFPEVFGALTPSHVMPVSPPDPALAQSPVIQRVEASVVKVVGVAPSCSRRIEGSGFVIAPERVLTNAHVVAGVQSPTVQVDGQTLDATVVLYDPDRDVAVLQVPGMQAQPLSFSTHGASKGDDAIILGYPQDGPFFVGPARIRQEEDIRGPNIYQSRTVDRETYVVRGDVRNGNSGGPLLNPDGTVYGVIFAAAVDASDTGYALTADEVHSDAVAGTSASNPVSTQACAA